MDERESVKTFQDVINTVCGHIPEGYEIQLYMENGAATVSMTTPSGHYAELPDAADKSIEEQLNDALCVANNFK